MSQVMHGSFFRLKGYRLYDSIDKPLKGQNHREQVRGVSEAQDKAGEAGGSGAGYNRNHRILVVMQTSCTPTASMSTA